MNREISTRERAVWWMCRDPPGGQRGVRGRRSSVGRSRGLTIHAEELDAPLAGVQVALLARYVAVTEPRRCAEAAFGAAGAGTRWPRRWGSRCLTTVSPAPSRLCEIYCRQGVWRLRA